MVPLRGYNSLTIKMPAGRLHVGSWGHKSGSDYYNTTPQWKGMRASGTCAGCAPAPQPPALRRIERLSQRQDAVKSVFALRSKAIRRQANSKIMSLQKAK